MLLSPYSTGFWQCNYPALLPFTRIVSHIFILAPVISIERVARWMKRVPNVFVQRTIIDRTTKKSFIGRKKPMFGHKISRFSQQNKRFVLINGRFSKQNRRFMLRNRRFRRKDGRFVLRNRRFWWKVGWFGLNNLGFLQINARFG